MQSSGAAAATSQQVSQDAAADQGKSLGEYEPARGQASERVDRLFAPCILPVRFCSYFDTEKPSPGQHANSSCTINTTLFFSSSSSLVCRYYTCIKIS